MGYVIGISLAIVVSLFAATARFDRDRAFYPTVTIVVASYYVLFAVMGGTAQTLMIECGFMTAFLLAAVVGFKFNLWIVAAALVGHGVFDFFHGHIVTSAGMPPWWPAFCGAYDVAAGACLAWLLTHGRDSKVSHQSL
jgi:hypothetical protein